MLRWFLIVSAGLTAFAALCLWFWPLNAAALAIPPNPAADYADALRRISDFDARESEKLSPEGRTEALLHGAKTERAIVLLHGITSCPQQFHAFGLLLFHAGYNVLLPRMPHHGLRDRMNSEQALLTAEEVSHYAAEAADIAQGLGAHVTLIGFSGSGVSAAWLAQKRPDIDKVVLIAPFFGVKTVPAALTRPAMNLYRLLPNSFGWWDDDLKEKIPPVYDYPRYSTKALAQLLRLGFAAQDEAEQSPPAAKAILIITNANDQAVNNAMTAQIAQSWRRRANEKVTLYEFPANLHLDHDMIDPGIPVQKTALVYPKILELLAK